MNSRNYRSTGLGLLLSLVLVPLGGTQAGDVEQELYERLAASVSSTDHTATACEKHQNLWITAIELTSSDLDPETLEQYRITTEHQVDVNMMSELIKRIAQRLPVHPNLAELKSAGRAGGHGVRGLSAYWYLRQGSAYWRACFDDELPKGQTSTFGIMFATAADHIVREMALQLSTCEYQR